MSDITSESASQPTFVEKAKPRKWTALQTISVLVLTAVVLWGAIIAAFAWLT